MENTTQTLPNGGQATPPRKEIKPKTGCLGSTMIIILLLVILLPIGIWMWRAYNRMVTKEESMNKAWSSVNIAYEKRAVIVEQLINTVRGSALFEKSTMTDVIKARGNALTDKEATDDSKRIDVDKTQAELTQAIKGLQSDFSKAGGLNVGVVVEAYPDLKSPELFKKLMDDLSAIETEIAKAREDYIKTVNDYNTYIRKFPKNIFSSIFGFDTHDYYQASPGSEKAPTKGEEMVNDHK